MCVWLLCIYTQYRQEDDHDRLYRCAYVRAGQIHFHQGDLTGSIEEYKIALEKDPKSAVTYAHMVESLCAKGDKQVRVPQHYARLCAVHPSRTSCIFLFPLPTHCVVSPPLIVFLSSLFFLFARTLSISLLLSVCALFVQGAMEWFLRCLDAVPEEVEVHAACGVYLCDTGQERQVMEKYTQFVKAHPSGAAAKTFARSLGNDCLERPHTTGMQ